MSDDFGENKGVPMEDSYEQDGFEESHLHTKKSTTINQLMQLGQPTNDPEPKESYDKFCV